MIIFWVASLVTDHSHLFHSLLSLTHTLSLHHTHPSNISLQAGEVSKQTHWLFLIVLNTCLDVYVDGRVGSGDGYCRKISGGMCG